LSVHVIFMCLIILTSKDKETLINGSLVVTVASVTVLTPDR